MNTKINMSSKSEHVAARQNQEEWDHITSLESKGLLDFCDLTVIDNPQCPSVCAQSKCPNDYFPSCFEIRSGKKCSVRITVDGTTLLGYLSSDAEDAIFEFLKTRIEKRSL